MGIREDQHFGLTYDAIDFLDRRVWKSKITTIREYSNGMTEESVNFELEGQPSGQYYVGVHGDQYTLYKYQDKQTDRCYYEYVQKEYWESGIVVFLALKDSDGIVVPESLWTICKCGFPAVVCNCRVLEKEVN